MKTGKILFSIMIAAAISASTASAAVIDMSGSFTTDILAANSTDFLSGDGFGPASGQSTNWQLRTDLTGTPAWPSSGGTFTAAGSGPVFQLGPFAGGVAGENNAAVWGGDASSASLSLTIDIANQSMASLSILHVAAFFDGTGDGTMTFNYTDASSSSAFTWDVADNLSPVGLGTLSQTAMSGLSIQNGSGNTAFGGRSLYYQTFTNPETGKVVDSITLSSGLITDATVEFAVLAMDATAIPEPSSFALIGLGLGAVLVLRRRK